MAYLLVIEILRQMAASNLKSCSLQSCHQHLGTGRSEDVHTGSALEFDLSRRWLPGGNAKESTWRMTATGHLMVCGDCNCIGMGFAMLELDFASSMGFVILLPKKKVMCPCSELAILRKLANMAFIHWLSSRAQVHPIVWVFFSTS